MKIQIINEHTNEKRGRVLVNLIVDGKKRSWNMPKGLWQVMNKLINDS